MKYHKVTLVISDEKLVQLAHHIKMQQYTGNFLPDILAEQDLAMTVCQAVKHDLELVVLQYDEAVHKILETIDEIEAEKE